MEQKKRTLGIIAAVGLNGEIGVRSTNSMPWKLPSDLARFKSLTMGGTLLMGRSTWESIDRELPGRTTRVVCRSAAAQEKLAARGIAHSSSLAEALEAENAQPDKQRGIWVIGGERLFEEALPLAELMIITHVQGEFPAADVFFPAPSAFRWQRTAGMGSVSDHKDSHQATCWMYRVHHLK